MVQVTGILRTPMGVPLVTEIRVTRSYCKGTLWGLQGSITTDSAGNYTFPLENGSYLVDILQNGEYTKPILIQVKADTPTPITLEELFALAEINECPEVPDEEVN